MQRAERGTITCPNIPDPVLRDLVELMLGHDPKLGVVAAHYTFMARGAPDYLYSLVTALANILDDQQLEVSAKIAQDSLAKSIKEHCNIHMAKTPATVSSIAKM